MEIFEIAYFEQISEKIWTGFPRALPPGINDEN